ncbi:MAG: GspH/FimT family pseudopilin [Gammaproteobacteria bacterium]|nr:GspH/FimT family pseudopilin [Gammaproteobacteria bacterium]
MNRKCGFTLLELIMTLAIAAIVITLGVPGFQEVIRNNRITAQTNELITALNLARSEAIKRGVPVTMCKTSYSVTATSPPTACNTSADWQQGWIIYADPGSNDGVIKTSEGDEILRVKEAMPTGFKLGTGGTFTNWIAYLPTGFNRGSGGLGNDTFRLCLDGNQQTGKEIIVNQAGRAWVKEGASSCP